MRRKEQKRGRNLSTQRHRVRGEFGVVAVK
jgi:hypothetical protein